MHNVHVRAVYGSEALPGAWFISLARLHTGTNIGAYVSQRSLIEALEDAAKAAREVEPKECIDVLVHRVTSIDVPADEWMNKLVTYRQEIDAHLMGEFTTVSK
jgi:hypothetical protein